MKYEIWSEGYRCTGNSSGAIFLGTFEAESFKTACDLLAENDKEFGRLYDSERMTFWGCRLFDNEADARELFG